MRERRGEVVVLGTCTYECVVRYGDLTPCQEDRIRQEEDVFKGWWGEEPAYSETGKTGN